MFSPSRLLFFSGRHNPLPLLLRGRFVKHLHMVMAQKASSSLFHDLQLPSGRRIQIPTGLFIDNAFHLAAEPSGTFESVMN